MKQNVQLCELISVSSLIAFHCLHLGSQFSYTTHIPLLEKLLSYARLPKDKIKNSMTYGMTSDELS